jgi:hypothetical protein
MDKTDDKLAIAARKLRVALDLQRFGIAMMRQKFVNRYPGESEAEITERVRSWLRDRPLDGPPGRVVSRFG